MKQQEKLKPTISAQGVSWGYLEKCKGKTIADFEYGFIETGSEVHQAERIILHFTDRSKLTIDIGSNACNVASDHKGLKPKDFHTDLMAKYSEPGS